MHILQLDSTQVQGDVEHLLRKRLLQKLTMSNTNVTVSMSGLAKLFPILRLVDVSNTTMRNKSVSELRHFVDKKTPLERLVLANCGLTGQLPTSLPPSLLRLDLQGNALYAGASEFTLDLTNTSIVLLDLSDNEIQAQLLSVETAANSTVILNLQSNPMPCPYPTSMFSLNVVALYAPCETSFAFIANVLGVAFALVAVGFGLYKIKDRLRPSAAVAPEERQEEDAVVTHPTTPRTRSWLTWLKILVPFVSWCTNSFDFGTDIGMNM